MKIKTECPYCGKSNRTDPPMDEGDMNAVYILQCPECGRYYRAIIKIRVTTTVKKMEEKNDN